jgi:O-antigen ligase
MAAILVPGLIPQSVATRLSGTTSADAGIYDADVTETLDRSSAHRLVLWRGALRMITERPLQGVGVGQFPQLIGNYTEVPLQEGEPHDAHNAFLLLAAEMGLPVLLLLIALHLTFAVMALRLHRRRRTPVDRVLALAFLGSQTGILVSCLLGSRFSDESLIAYFWILSALVVVTSRLRETPPPARVRAWR